MKQKNLLKNKQKKPNSISQKNTPIIRKNTLTNNRVIVVVNIIGLKFLVTSTKQVYLIGFKNTKKYNIIY